MKKILILAAIAIFLLCACAVEQQVGATGQPAQTAFATPDTSMSTPTIGSAIVKNLEGKQTLLLRSQPDPKSAPAGQVALDAKGKVLGLSADGSWVLVQFPEYSGWAPTVALQMIIAQ
jgi:hypothetical protein